MPAHVLPVTTIGKIAREALAQGSQANVIGITSRGLFLRLASDWVIFLSFEPHRGPLTINLPEHPRRFHELEIRSIAKYSVDEIHFPGIGLSLSLSFTNDWSASNPKGQLQAPDQLQAKLIEVASLAIQVQPATGLVTLLPFVLDTQKQTSHHQGLLCQELLGLQAAYLERQIHSLAVALTTFIGLGTGLTPSGDDLVLGFLLALNRWGQQLTPDLEVAVLNREVLAHACRNTSALSASLIACAASGQADERLILALDDIVSGTPDANRCITALSGWGSSSGLDALVGMALYLRR